MKKPPKSEERREFLRRIGSKGGKIGGKRSLETMTQAARIARAYRAGKQRRTIDHARVMDLRRAGRMGREIAAELKISQASVWRILREAAKKRGSG